MSFTVYKSSAGSGKTYTLVREYLKLILPEPGRFRNILAITFTNKAANEMKERVMEGLRELSLPADQYRKKNTLQLMQQLVKETGFPVALIALKAAEALQLILHHYSDFAIGTIDGFSHRIVRTFARDFGLPVNFTVSLESKELRKTAIDLLLNKVGEDKSLTDLLVRFLETMTEEDKGWNIDKILLDFSAILEDEESMTHLEKLKSLHMEDFLRIAGKMSVQSQLLEVEMMVPGIKTLQLIQSNGISPESFYRTTSGFLGYMSRIANGNFTNLEVKTYVRETLEEGKWTSKSVSSPEKDKIEAIAGELLTLFEDFQQLRATQYPYLILLELLKKNIYPLAVLNLIESLLAEFKKQNNIVQVGEFNRHISKIIINEPVPFIYERLGERFQHILIDEFQDTSRMQWGNLLPLIENALASGSFNLVVGDGKQAIYRWRNGEVGQFVSLPALEGSDTNPLIKSRENLLVANYQENSLQTNYRSRKNIIEFNNGFFSSLKNVLDEETRKVYQEVEQLSDQAAPGGFISLEMIGEGDAAGYSENTCNRILEIIRELEGRNFQWKDIAILCRANNKAGEIARFLMLNGIDVISAESLLLSFSPEVKLLVNFLCLFSDPDNQLIQSEIMVYLHHNGHLSGDIHKILRTIAGQATEKHFYLNLRQAGYDLDYRSLSMLPLYDLVEELIRIFSLNKKPDPYVQFFLDAVLKFSRDNSSGMSGFAEWWKLESTRMSVVVPEGLNAIHVMTIHKAKGLQFPVVIFPFASERKKYSKNYLWLDLPSAGHDGLPAAMVKPEKKLAETPFREIFEEEDRKSTLDLVNILYVAMTRPEEMLYVLSQTPPKESNTVSVPGLLKQYLTEIDRWEEGTNIYTFGEPVNHEFSSKETTGNRILTEFISNDWRSQIRIRSRAPVKWDVDDPERNRSRGNMVHDILSKIKTRKDAPAVLAGAITAGIIPQELYQEISGLINQILEHPDIAPFFADDLKVRNEMEILKKDGSVFRPDRVILTDDSAIVMDYKTGKPSESHEKQVKDYESLLLEMEYINVKKYLLYFDPEIKLIEVI